MKKILKLFLMLLVFITGTSGIFAQITVTGKVIDTDNQPVIGANVVVKGTTTGTMTGVDGKFSISAPSASSIIVVSFIGYVPQERKLELAGEGFRRYDLIRTGKMPEKIKQLRDLQIAMVNGLETSGYYTFANGNQIPAYIYTKKVNVADLSISKMLTTQCTVAEADATYPVRFPSWRGNSDAWSAYTGTTGTRNLAIQGIFRNITGAEATALVAAGYAKTAWGSVIVTNKGQYTTSIFKGYTDAYYAAGVPPRYLLPLSSETISKSNGLISNGYGFAQE